MTHRKTRSLTDYWLATARTDDVCLDLVNSEKQPAKYCFIARSADSGWYLVCAQGINGAGEITGFGVINGDMHAYLLRPSDRNNR